MDFVVGLPESKEFNTRSVVVDHLTKLKHLVSCTATVDGKKLDEIYIREVMDGPK
jgi:hypothetical protein